MIPTINITIKDCSETGYNLSQQSKWIIGQAYCYEWNTTQEAAIKNGLNLDGFLTLQIGYHVFMKKPKERFLIWYAPLNSMFFLTVTRKGSKIITEGLSEISGYKEQGQDYLKENSRPFLYYDGLNVTRVYLVHEMIQEGEYYVSDFGSLFGLNVAITEQDSYKDIRDNPADYWDCSAVPFEAGQAAEWRGKKFVINHAFCKLI